MGSVLMEMPDGSKQRFDAASLLQAARDHAAQMRKDASLFETAAMCAMGKE
jgi:predicted NAD/FAD-binding protein